MEVNLQLQLLHTSLVDLCLKSGDLPLYAAAGATAL